MKNVRIITTIICTFAVLTVAASAQAQVVSMSDSELAGVTGQAGFAALGSHIALQRAHGMGSMSTSPFPLSDLSYQSERTGTMGEIRISDDGKSYSFDIHNPGISIRDFQARIHTGNPAEAGNSLGTIRVGHVQVVTHGTVRITVR